MRVDPKKRKLSSKIKKIQNVFISSFGMTIFFEANREYVIHLKDRAVVWTCSRHLKLQS